MAFQPLVKIKQHLEKIPSNDFQKDSKLWKSLKIIQKCIYLPVYHTFIFYDLNFSKANNTLFLHFSKAK